MKLDEFQNKVEKNGKFRLDKTGNHRFVVANKEDGEVVAVVHKFHRFRFSFTQEFYFNVDEEDQVNLAKICSLFSSTPIEDRDDETTSDYQKQVEAEKSENAKKAYRNELEDDDDSLDDDYFDDDDEYLDFPDDYPDEEDEEDDDSDENTDDNDTNDAARALLEALFPGFKAELEAEEKEERKHTTDSEREAELEREKEEKLREATLKFLNKAKKIAGDTKKKLGKDKAGNDLLDRTLNRINRLNDKRH